MAAKVLRKNAQSTRWCHIQSAVWQFACHSVRLQSLFGYTCVDLHCRITICGWYNSSKLCQQKSVGALGSCSLSYTTVIVVMQKKNPQKSVKTGKVPVSSPAKWPLMLEAGWLASWTTLFVDTFTPSDPILVLCLNFFMFHNFFFVLAVFHRRILFCFAAFTLRSVQIFFFFLAHLCVLL